MGITVAKMEHSDIEPETLAKLQLYVGDKTNELHVHVPRPI